VSAQCCGVKGTRQFARRCGDTAGWLGSAALLAVLPKCPACLAAYVGLATGLALSVQIAAVLRVVLVALSVASLSYFLYRTLRLGRNSVKFLLMRR
jgi:hypothetical protein